MLKTKDTFGLYTDFLKNTRRKCTTREKILFLTLKMLSYEKSTSEGWTKTEAHLKNQLLTDVLDSLEGDNLNKEPEVILETLVCDLRDHGVISSKGRNKRGLKARNAKLHEKIRALLN